MKKSILIFFLCIMMQSVLSQEKRGITHFQVGEPMGFLPPFQLSETDIQGNPLDENRRVETYLSLPKDFHSFTQKEVEENHPLLLPTPEEGYAFQWVRFRLNVKRFSRIHFFISTHASFEGYINGEKKKFDCINEKEASTCPLYSIELNCVPRTYEFLFKLHLSQERGREEEFSAFYQVEQGDTQSVEENLSDSRMLHISNFVEATQIEECVLSPKGNYALIEKDASSLEEAHVLSSWEIVDVKRGETLYRKLGETENVGWMPREEKVYYTSKENNSIELYTISLTPKIKEECIAHHLPEGAFQWGNEERFLYYTIEEKPKEEEGNLRRYLSPEDRQPQYRTRTRLARYDLEKGFLQPLTFGSKSAIFDDLTGETHLLFRTTQNDEKEYPFYFTSLYRMNLQSLQVDTIRFHAPHIQYDVPQPHSFCFLGNGETCALIASPMAFGEMGKTIGEEEMPNIYECDLYLLHLKTKAVECVTLNFSPSLVEVKACKWEKNRLLLLCYDKDCRTLYSYNIKEKTFEQLPLEVEVVKDFSLSAQSPILLYWGESASKAMEVWLYDFKTKHSTLLSSPSKPQFEGAELAEVKEWNFKNSAGDRIDGRYYLPPHFNPSQKYPLIVYYYGGTIAFYRCFTGLYPLHLYAAQGYVVYVPEPSGAIGYGQAFSAKHVNGWGGRAVEDIIEGVEAFCKEHEFVDSSRVGCIGASYGGFTTQSLLTKCSLFKAAVSHAGISALASYWGEGYWGYSYSAAATAHRYPWTHPQYYTEQSPLFSADKIQTPLLLLHGEADTNVPIGESIQLFTALKLLGREVEFVEIKGENHHILSPSKRIEWQNTIFAWFAKYLQDSPKWWESLYPKEGEEKE